MKVYGLDPSLTSTGWASPDDQGAICSKKKGMQRLQEIKLDVRELIPDDAVVFIEGYAMSKQTSHAHAQGELGGILRLDLFERDIPFIEVPPTSLKKYITGKGNANKAAIVSHATAVSGIVWDGGSAEDMADAWSLRQFGCHILGAPEIERPKANLEVFKKIDLSPLDELDWAL